MNVEIPEDIYFAVRVDGNNFHRLTAEMEKPFDKQFGSGMDKAALDTAEEFNALCAYTQSDEISYIFDKECNLYNRRREKFLSLLASCTSGKFTSETGLHCMFDARVIPLKEWFDVEQYLEERQEDCYRNAVNAAALYNYIKHGDWTTSSATKQLHGLKQHELIATMEKDDVWMSYPFRFKNGSLARKNTYDKAGYNPKDNEITVTTRTKWEIGIAPIFRYLTTSDIKNYLGVDY